MKDQNILIIGGYGIVGMEVANILSRQSAFKIYIAGRNVEKAKKAATAYNYNWKYLDVQNVQSIKEALEDIDIVVNCFIASDEVNITVAEIVAETGKKYIDVAAVPLEHLFKIKELDQKAKRTGALLITGLGVNPGIIGLVIKYHSELLSEVEKTEVFFTMGSNFNEISVLSLIGIADLIQLPPEIWKNNTWIAPNKPFKRHYIGEPFNKKVFFGPGAITPDIKCIDSLATIRNIQLWSGIESFWATVVLLYNINKGRTKTNEKASHLLKRLQKKGNKKKFSKDTNLTIRSWKANDKKGPFIETSFYCPEIYSTALAPSIGCALIHENKIKALGAFYATEVINPREFIDKLRNYKINFKEVKTNK